MWEGIGVTGYQPKVLVLLPQITHGLNPEVKMHLFVFWTYWMGVFSLTSHLFFMAGNFEYLSCHKLCLCTTQQLNRGALMGCGV